MPKKYGRMDNAMAATALRIRFIYYDSNSDLPLYGEWHIVSDVMRQTMFASDVFDVMGIEFDTLQG